MRIAKRLRQIPILLRSLAAPAAFVLTTLLLAASAVTLVRFALHSPRFAIKTIRFEGAVHAHPDELRGRIGLGQDENIFRTSLANVDRDVESSPWVEKAKARRELPDTLVVRVWEYEPRAIALLGHLYLIDGNGQVFKRATQEEVSAQSLPIVTGLDRVQFLNDRIAGEARLREAMRFIDLYQQASRPRPPLGEVHLEGSGPPTLYTRKGAVQIRLGEASTEEALSRFDQVWAALGPDTARARAIYLDHRTHRDRVVVRMSGTQAQ